MMCTKGVLAVNLFSLLVFTKILVLETLVADSIALTSLHTCLANSQCSDPKDECSPFDDGTSCVEDGKSYATGCRAMSLTWTTNIQNPLLVAIANFSDFRFLIFRANNKKIHSIDSLNGTRNYTFCCFNRSNPNPCFHITLLKVRTYFAIRIEILDVVESISKYSLQGVNPKDYEAKWNITFQDCPQYFNSVQVFNDGSNFTFDSEGEYHCDNGGILFDNRENIPVISNYTKCGKCQQWTNQSYMQCWKGPTVTISNIPVYGNWSSEQTIVNGICNVTDRGFPPNKPPSLVWEGTLLTSPLTLEPKHYNTNIWCEIENAYTLHYGKPGRSQNRTIKLVFGPYEISNSTKCVIETGNSSTFKVELYVEFCTNLPPGRLQMNNTARILDANGTENETKHFNKVPFRYFVFNITNVSVHEVVDMIYYPGGNNPPVKLGNLNLTAGCFPTESEQFTRSTLGYSETSWTSSDVDTEPPSLLPVTTIIGVVVGGIVLLVLLIIIFVWLIVRKKRKSETHVQNCAYAESSLSKSQGNSEREDRQNILYDTCDGLKSGKGPDKKEMVDNVFYGTTTNVNADASGESSKDLYTTVQKPAKKKGKPKTEDPGASTSGLQTESTYAVLNKKKKVKTSDKESGQENAGYSGEVQQESTYAVVDKKKKKVEKGKSANQPSTSALTEESTYAVVQKKGNRKPKKDDDEDEDLHGSNQH